MVEPATARARARARGRIEEAQGRADGARNRNRVAGAAFRERRGQTVAEAVTIYLSPQGVRSGRGRIS